MPEGTCLCAPAPPGASSWDIGWVVQPQAAVLCGAWECVSAAVATVQPMVQLLGQEVAVLPGRMWPWHGEGMVPYTDTDRMVCVKEGQCAALERCAINMGAEWRRGGEVGGARPVSTPYGHLAPATGPARA